MSWLSPDYDENGRPIWPVKKNSLADWGLVVLITSPAWVVVLAMVVTTFHYFNR